MDLPENTNLLKPLLLGSYAEWSRTGSLKLVSWLKKYPKPNGDYFKKTELLSAYRQFSNANLLPFNQTFADEFRKKPRRTLSGVTPITVLTKPYPCPGTCIFCPNDLRMPKSYLASEPGAQRALHNAFDPYLQTYNRLLALQAMGHPTAKAELLVLGGTWSVYPVKYQIWFIKRLFDALNDFGGGLDNRPKLPELPQNHTFSPGKKSYNQAIKARYQLKNPAQSASWKDLAGSQYRNEGSSVRCVGLVLETRPDYLTLENILHLRRLGATKIQVGVQSLQDKVLKLNRRGHQVKSTREAFKYLRRFGFKIHAHWMPNLYGSRVIQDKKDYQTLFTDPDFLPDELKIYPCSLIENTGLMAIYRHGGWRPYNHEELLELLAFCLENTPPYCRLSRVVRDIPSPEIVTGNKTTNFREIAEAAVVKRGGILKDIRSREINNISITPNDFYLNSLVYTTSVSTEHFLQFINGQNLIAAFLRLSLPIRLSSYPVIPELADSALIREVHVYGQSVAVGRQSSQAQHQGLGKNLIKHAVGLAKNHGFSDLAVISAVGTRPYYRGLGFTDGELYQHYEL